MPSMEPKNVLFMSSCSLYTGQNYMHYSLMGEIMLQVWLSFWRRPSMI